MRWVLLWCLVLAGCGGNSRLDKKCRIVISDREGTVVDGPVFGEDHPLSNYRVRYVDDVGVVHTDQFKRKELVLPPK